MKNIILLILLLLMSGRVFTQEKLSLNGIWESGEERNYIHETTVPGIATDPARINSGKLWYKKEITLPEGEWTQAILELKGARFAPEIVVNGTSVSKKEGGMAPTFHLLQHPDIQPGSRVILEVALSTLNELSSEDASYIPKADQWRSNISSCLWDDVILHLSGNSRIARIVPFYDLAKKEIRIEYEVQQQLTLNSGKCKFRITDETGKILIAGETPWQVGKNTIVCSYNELLKEWSPETPNLYQLHLELIENNKLSDQETISIGIKDFRVVDKQFHLNGNPYKLRGGTVVWHRWVRSEEGRIYGYDEQWFLENIILRLKEHGANYLRFHLGVPPERILRLCDQYGLAVQYEWSFFHGMPASRESCVEQYEQWLSLAMRHPCITLYHPYNETEGDQLEIVWSALDELLVSYPPLVMEERDVIHVHKYWWSLFENLGLYYDSYDQFDKAIMVDEFGGNYLDEKGDMGGYKSIPESYLRFLGRNHTAEMRLKHLALSNGKVAEYWRRIGAAGVSPFCIASSWEDGNTWFMGKLSEGKPKSVWNALTPAWAPLSVSLELWDKHFLPGQEISLPLYFFNDTGHSAILMAQVTIEDKFGKIYEQKEMTLPVNSFSKEIRYIPLSLPEKSGDFVIKAQLMNRPENVQYPVISEWEIRTYQVVVPEELKGTVLFIPDYEKELQDFARNNQLQFRTTNKTKPDFILISEKSWEKITEGDKKVKTLIGQAIENGVSVVMLDVGNRELGQGYPPEDGDLGPLQGVAKVTDPAVEHHEIFGGIVLTSKEAAEPETHLFPDLFNKELWKHLPADYNGMWNGLRGGLVVPAADMEISGLNSDAFLEQWKARGADEEKIKEAPYYAYELQGFFEFSLQDNDRELQQRLKEKVLFLVEDAPALASAINPHTPVKKTNLHQEYKDAEKGIAKNLTVLANAGKNFTRTPVVLIDFGENRGKLLVSQLLTAGRLAPTYGEEGLYGIRYDVTAVQTVLNMLTIAKPD